MELTAKEKAKELVINFYNVPNNQGICKMTRSQSINCALLAVHEILNSYNTKYLIYPKEVAFYNEVKEEIKIFKSWN